MLLYVDEAVVVGEKSVLPLFAGTWVEYFTAVSTSFVPHCVHFRTSDMKVSFLFSCYNNIIP